MDVAIHGSCVFIYAHKRSMLASFDCIMVMLILLQPSFPVHIGFAQSVGNAVSVVMGPAIALLACHFIFPAHQASACSICSQWCAMKPRFVRPHYRPTRSIGQAHPPHTQFSARPTPERQTRAIKSRHRRRHPQAIGQN